MIRHKVNLFISILLLCSAVLLQADTSKEAALIIQFSGRQNKNNHSLWIRDSEIVLENWYFDLANNKVIPPYLGWTPEISPYDGTNCFFYSSDYLYLWTIDEYAKAIPPRAVLFPDEFRLTELLPEGGDYFHRVSAWISGDEIIFIDKVIIKDINVHTVFSDTVMCAVYSISSGQWTMFQHDSYIALDFIDIMSLQGYSDGRLVFITRHPEIPFYIHIQYQYFSEGGEKNRLVHITDFSELGPRTGVSPETIEDKYGNLQDVYYDINITDNSIFYSTILDGVYYIVDPITEKRIRHSELPLLPDNRYYAESLLSPGEQSLLIYIRDKQMLGTSYYYHSRETVKYMILGAVSQNTQMWNIDIKEFLGTELWNYPETCTIETVIEDVLQTIPFTDNEYQHKKNIIRDWLFVFNDFLFTENKNAESTTWIIPARGTLLYILGEYDQIFSIELANNTFLDIN